MYCIVPSTTLFSKGEWTWCFGFRNRQACGCHVPPSVETGCLPNSSVRDAINRLAAKAPSLQKTCQPEVFACVLAQWPPRARHVWDQPQSVSHQWQIPLFSPSLKAFSGDCVSESISRWRHGSYGQICLMPLLCFYRKDPESKGTGNKRYPLAWPFAFDVPVWIIVDLQL